MEKYDSYKNSGVEWIGEIPSHWGTTRIKYTSKDDKYSFIDGDWIESKNLSDDGVRYITTGNIGEGKYKEQGKGYISEETFEKLSCTEIFEGDLIISRLSLPVGRSCILPHIHYKVSRRGYHELTTQMYFAGESLNESDRLLRSVAKEDRDLLVVDFREIDGTPQGDFPIVLAKVV